MARQLAGRWLQQCSESCAAYIELGGFVTNYVGMGRKDRKPVTVDAATKSTFTLRRYHRGDSLPLQLARGGCRSHSYGWSARQRQVHFSRTYYSPVVSLSARPSVRF